MSRRPINMDEIAAIGGATGVIAASFMAFRILERTQGFVYFLVVAAGFVIGALALGALAKLWNTGTQGEARTFIS